MLDKEQVAYIAKLARINLDEKEMELLSGQLHSIIDFIDQLKSADINQVNPTSHILPASNILRQDELKPTLPIAKTLANAPQKKEGFFKVPKVID